MPVYVDRSRNPYRGMIMCHMLADSPEELHAMADRIGISRRHFQGKASTPHYDICMSKRALAVKAGAIEIDRKETVGIIRKLRSINVSWKP